MSALAGGAALLLVLLVLLGPARSGLHRPGRAPARASDSGPETTPFGFGPTALPSGAAGIPPNAGARTLIRLAAEAGRTPAAGPGSAEAAVTRALAFERLHLPHVARQAWEKVVDLAPGTDLAAEAREHLEALQIEPSADEAWAQDRAELETVLAADDAERVQELVDRHHQRVRQWIQDEVLPGWAEAAQGGDEARAARSLASARHLAAVLEQLTGDHLTVDSVAALDGASGIARWQLAQGHALYGEARKLHDHQDYEHAGPIFQQAAAALEAGASPFALWPRLYLAIEDYHAPHLRVALAALRALENRYDPESFPIFDGYVHWILGLVRGRSGPTTTGLPDCRAAIERFRATGELENETAVRDNAAASLVQAGDLEGAWRHLDLGFQARPRLGAGRASENLLWAAIEALRAGGRPSAALPLADENLAEAEARRNALGLSLALRKRAELLTDLGADEETLDAGLDDAREMAERIPDARIRRDVESEALIGRGRARCARDPAGGIDDLDRAERFVRASGQRHLLIQVLAERARCRRGEGNAAGAEEDLARALGELERQRKLIHDPTLRTYYVDQARAVLEERVALALDRGDVAGAFATVERLRAPVLLEAMGETVPPAEPSVLAGSLPPGTSLVELLSLERELVAWVLDDTRGVSLVTMPISRTALAADVQAFRQAVARGDSARDSRVETALSKALLPALGDARSIVVVPDGPLHDLPFAALRDPATGRRLAERFALATAPSARAYAALEDRSRYLGASRPRRALAVGGVPFARELFPALEALPDSAGEAQAVAAAYPAGTALTGEAATPERFLADAAAYDVIHLATHAVDFPGEPEMASLLLAPASDGSGDGILPARDLRFPRPLSARVVVLAACRTAEGRSSASEGPLNLARPFLAAGAPTVVATLWSLDEATSLAFSKRFHAALAAGAAPIEAFHTAQLDLLRSPDPRLAAPRSWAGLVLIGATDGTGGP